MIKISRLADYSFIILSYLAAYPNQLYSAAALAERTGIVLPTVSKILKLLNDSQIIQSSRGSNGGYLLAKEAGQLNLAEIIGAVDGKPALTECCQIENNCIHDMHCNLRSHWQFINKIINQVLSQFTLADLKDPAVIDQWRRP